MERSIARERKNARISSCARLSGATAALLGMAALLPAGSAVAGSYLVEGLGTIKCSEFTANEADNGEPLREDQQWVVGFISGYNNALAQSRKDSNIGSNTDVDAVMKLIDSYCRQNPGDELTDAASALMKYFRSNRQ